MKKVLKSLLYSAFCAFTALSFSACNDNDEDKPIIINSPPYTLCYNTDAYYKGDIYNAGTGSLSIKFQHNSLSYDATIEDFKGQGYILCLNFNIPLPSNPDYVILPDGSYAGTQSDENHAEFTLNLADGESYITIYEGDGKPSTYDFTSAKVYIVHKGYGCNIHARLLRSDGFDFDFDFLATFPDIINISNEGEQSNLSKDLDLTAKLTQGCFTILSDRLKTKASNYATIILAGKDYDIENNYGKDHSVTIGINVTPGAELLPDGTYEILNFDTTNDLNPFTAYPGSYESAIDSYKGCWYRNSSYGFQAALRKGSVSINRTSATAYIIKYDLLDGYNHHVTGTYKGTVHRKVPVD